MATNCILYNNAQPASKACGEAHDEAIHNHQRKPDADIKVVSNKLDVPKEAAQVNPLNEF